MIKMKSVMKNTITTLVILNILLAVVALIRDIVLASFLGTTAEADALLLAFFLPDTIGNNLLAASVGITCIPIFTQIYLKKDSNEFNDLVKSMVMAIFLCCLFIMGIGYLFQSQIIGIIGKGLSSEIKELSTRLFAIMLPTLIFYPIITIGSSLCHIRNKFIIPALAPIIFNIVFLMGIAAGYILKIPRDKAIIIIAYSITLGVIMMFLLIWTDITRRKWINIFRFDKFRFKKDNFSAFIKIYIPYMAVLFAFQSVLYIERYIASLLEVGTIAGLNYAYRVSQLPIWVFVAAVSTFSFPSVAKLKADSQEVEMKKSVLKFLKLTLIIVFPMSLIIYILRLPIIQILFQWGAFDDNSIKITADILTGYSIAIIGQGIFWICIRFFMAIKSMVFPMIVVLFSSAINIAADFLLVKYIGSSGLGYGAAIGSMTNGILLIIVLNKKLDLEIEKKMKTFFKILVAGIPVAIVSFVFRQIWNITDQQTSMFMKLLFGFTAFIFCSCSYGLSLHYLKIQDMNFRSLNSKE